MGSFSRDTFNKLMHYVGVRLQQGVPIVDADWNEQEDIRKYELQTFLKWFVGNGIPKGNDGFRILSASGNAPNTINNAIILTSHKTGIGPSSLEVSIENTPGNAAEALGFGPDNHSVSGAGPLPLQLVGNVSAPFPPDPSSPTLEGKTLKITIDGAIDTVTFTQDQFAHIQAATANEVVKAINESETMSHITANVSAENDFIIRGGNRTPEGAGHCLVDGWGVINECNLKYTKQRLYDNQQLADAWEVPVLEALEPPQVASGSSSAESTRTDLVYLDVWEREVDSEEDVNLKNEKIGIETCLRLKREWVVRVKPGETILSPDDLLPGHSYYPLALLTRQAGVNAIRQEQIKDLRMIGLSIMSYNDDVQQIIKDSYGNSYTLDHDGQPNLKVSLREAINALLRGELPGTNEMRIPTPADSRARSPFALEDYNGDIWVFWQLKRNGDYNILCNRFEQSSGNWLGEENLTINITNNILSWYFALQDSKGIIWVFLGLRMGENDKDIIYYTRKHVSSSSIDNWETEPVVKDEGAIKCSSPFALEESNGRIWIFWHSELADKQIWSSYWDYSNDNWNGNWEDIRKMTDDSSPENKYPFALEDSYNVIWLFWQSKRPNGKWNIRYKCKEINGIDWESDEHSLEETDVDYDQKKPFALEDSNRIIWIFWHSGINGNYNIWYKRYNLDSSRWEDAKPLTKDFGDNTDPFVLEDNNGDIWVFWQSNREGNYDIWYNRYKREGGWDRSKQLTTSPLRDICPFALKDGSGYIWALWSRQEKVPAGELVIHQPKDVFYRRLIPAL